MDGQTCGYFLFCPQVQGLIQSVTRLQSGWFKNGIFAIGLNVPGLKLAVGALVTKLQSEFRTRKPGKILLQRVLLLVGLPAKPLEGIRLLQGVVKIAVHQGRIGKQTLVEQVVPANGGGFVAPVHLEVIVKTHHITSGVSGYKKAVVVVDLPVYFAV